MFRLLYVLLCQNGRFATTLISRPPFLYSASFAISTFRMCSLITDAFEKPKSVSSRINISILWPPGWAYPKHVYPWGSSGLTAEGALKHRPVHLSGIRLCFHAAAGKKLYSFPINQSSFHIDFSGLPLEGLRSMPPNLVTIKNSSSLPIFHKKCELFRLPGKIQSP